MLPKSRPARQIDLVALFGLVEDDLSPLPLLFGEEADVRSRIVLAATSPCGVWVVMHEELRARHSVLTAISAARRKQFADVERRWSREIQSRR